MKTPIHRDAYGHIDNIKFYVNLFTCLEHYVSCFYKFCGSGESIFTSLRHQTNHKMHN